VTSNAIGAAVIYHFTAPSLRTAALEKSNLEADSVCGLFHFRLWQILLQKVGCNGSGRSAFR
jgi:hypothetical protein